MATLAFRDYITCFYSRRTTRQMRENMSFLMVFSWVSLPGYAVPNAATSVSAAQLKQAVTLGQDLTAYTTYEVYPTFAVTARGDGYGAFWRYLSFNFIIRHAKPALLKT